MDAPITFVKDGDADNSGLVFPGSFFLALSTRAVILVKLLVYLLYENIFLSGDYPVDHQLQKSNRNNLGFQIVTMVHR